MTANLHLLNPLPSRRIFTIIALLVVLTGCKNYEDRIPVNGQITLDGAPLADGFVAFVGDEGYAVASGLVQNGHYELSESASRNGIPAGQYAIRIESWKDPPGKELPNGTFSEGISAIPARYRDAKTSGFTVEVSQKSRKFDFAMNSMEK